MGDIRKKAEDAGKKAKSEGKEAVRDAAGKLKKKPNK